ncbi:DNA helicase B [Trichosurus vulpecula]|uniref:DNA helicase B n=1 Tax=Trichosurus vulpecula TaxID=9337 RepID=UPI00186AD788|nr:DNA helicase B [Trichosurus vulpecula]
MGTPLVLLGRLLPDKNPQKEEDEGEEVVVEEDEEDEPLFVEAEELCNGGLRSGSLPSRVPVVIEDENTTENIRVFGRFPLFGPWWKVKVKVKRVGSRYFVDGLPSYFLETDLSSKHEDICSLFLKACDFPDDFKSNFLKWVYKRSSYCNLSFANLQEALKDFEEWQKESSGGKDGNSSQEKKNQSLLNRNPIALRTVMRALMFPRIMEFIPILLPRHFHNFLNLEHPESLLRDLEEILNTCPWKLGFSRIIYRELKLIGCEATWLAFCHCESLFQKMSNLEKNALITYNKLKQICREYGHTYVKEAELTSRLSGMISFQDVWSSLKFLKDIGVVTNEKECIFISDLYEAEKDVASLVHDLMTSPSWNLKVDVKEVLASMETRKFKHAEGDDAGNTSKPQEEKLVNDGHDLDVQSNSNQVFHSDENQIDFEMPSQVQLDLDQVAALEMICSNAVTVVSGKGGCGKTTIVSHLFKYVEQMEETEVWQACKDFEQDLDAPEEWNTFVHQSEWNNKKRIEVLLTAPTGKAASLLREKTRLAAYTLHQVKYSFYSWQRTNQKLEDKIPWKFSSVKVLVVDEGSLVCIAIFRSVLNLLRKHARLVKLIILGDIRQLPSIEPGNLLMDLFETLKSRNCAVELKTNHRAESQLIVDNAARISRRLFPKFDAELTISDGLANSIPDQNKRFIFVRLPEDNSHSQSSQRNYCSYLYSAVKTLLNGAVELKEPKTSQFIAFRKQDCDVINECCCSFYSGHLTKNHKNRLIFQRDDKICCTRNAYLSDLLCQNSNSLQNEDLELDHPGDLDASYHNKKSKKSHGSVNDIRLCNGEIFYITDDVQNENGRFLTINNMAGLEVTVDFQKLVNFCRIRHAWARTIHTFQGSEEDTVVYVVGKAGRQHWQHVYTAITRGRSRVYVIAEESQLRKAVKQNSFPRKTRLKHFLQRNFADSYTFPEEVSSPSKSCGQSQGHSSQPSATPLDPIIPGTVGNSFIKTHGSVDKDVTLITNGEEKLVSFEETDEEEDSWELRGTKRSTTNDFESPNKLLLVEQTSPLVSSRLQNMTLKSLTPKQLFKTAVSEGI